MLESLSRAGGKKKAASMKAGGMMAQNMASARGAEQPSGAGRAAWKEGELLPEGWEDMDVGQKVSEIYMGERGILYWLQQAAWFSSIGLAVAWVIFRFVGPSLGLYNLANELTSVSL